MVKSEIPEKIKKIVEGYVDRLSRQDKLPIEKVIIFGSSASGRPHKWSDIDLCVISPRFKDNIAALAYLWRRRNDEEVKAGLEPIGFSQKTFQEGGPLTKEISRTGIEINV